MRGAHVALSIRSRNALPKHSADESRYRFHGGIFWAVHLWSGGGAFENFAAGICARSIREIQNHVCKPGTAGVEESAKRIASTLRCLGSRKTKGVRSPGSGKQSAHEKQAATGAEQAFIEAGARSVRRAIARDYCGWCVYRAGDAAIFLQLGNSR